MDFLDRNHLVATMETNHNFNKKYKFLTFDQKVSISKSDNGEIQSRNSASGNTMLSHTVVRTVFSVSIKLRKLFKSVPNTNPHICI